MDFEKCWQTLVDRAKAKGMDITKPETEVVFTAEKLKVLLGQFRANGVETGTRRERAGKSLADLFEVFGGRK